MNFLFPSLTLFFVLFLMYLCSDFIGKLQYHHRTKSSKEILSSNSGNILSESNESDDTIIATNKPLEELLYEDDFRNIFLQVSICYLVCL